MHWVLIELGKGTALEAIESGVVVFKTEPNVVA
jgi:hypothetical protein